jgi:hypothetical protein
MAAAGGHEDKKYEFRVRPSGMSIEFKTPEGTTAGITIITTFTRVEEDAYKITFHELLHVRGEPVRHDLLYRHTHQANPGYSGRIYSEQCIIVREDLHIVEKTAREIWTYLSRDTPFMNGGDSPVAELTTRSRMNIIAAAQYLEKIAESLHGVRKRQAAAAAKASSKSKGSKALASRAKSPGESGPSPSGSPKGMGGGSRKYKNSKRVLRRKSRATRRG